MQDLLPGVPAVAYFDTAFQATLPAEARTYLRRYEAERVPLRHLDRAVGRPRLSTKYSGA